MAQLPRGISSSFSILLFISYLGLSNFVFAQLTLERCAVGAANEYRGLYEGIMSRPTRDMPMSFCPLWAAVCSYVHRNCPSAATCIFTNYDPEITARYNPSSPTSYTSFLRCSSCDVQVSVPARELLPYGILVPTQSGTTRGPRPTNPPTGRPDSMVNIHDVLAYDESPDDMLAETYSASSTTSAITTILVVGSIVGSLIAVKTATAGFHAGDGAGATVGATAPISNPKTGSGSGQSVIDAVTLLLHFQSISTSGLLSISYPALYRFFSYNFAWANLIIASDGFKNVVRSYGTNPSCLRTLGSLNPGVTDDPYSWTGMTVMGARYDLNRATLGGLVYLSAIIGVAIALAVFFLVFLVLGILNGIFKSRKLQAQVEIWPSRASSMSLRLFIWVFGSVSTFAIYQFIEPCSSSSLVTFASVEFVLIILTLLIVSTFIIKTAKTQGPEALFWLSESEESKYSRKWGSLYANLKPAMYWFFVPDYVWIFAKSLIVGVGQGSGLTQVCCLIGVEVATLFALLSKRPYETSAGNAFYIFSACKRVFSSVSLLVFWGGFHVPTNIKRNLGIVLIVAESAYAVALFVTLLLNGGAAFVKWNTERKEQRRASADTEGTTTTSLPHLYHTDWHTGNTSPVLEKSNEQESKNP